MLKSVYVTIASGIYCAGDLDCQEINCGSDGSGDCLNPAYSKRFATYLSTVARHARDHWNIHFRSVEAFNEPAPGWWKFPGRQEGRHFDLSTQRTSLAELRSALDAAGLHDVLTVATVCATLPDEGKYLTGNTALLQEGIAGHG